MHLDNTTRGRLATVSTATVTTVLFKRGLRNAFIQGCTPLAPGKPTMVGPASTLRYVPAREDLDHFGVFADREHPQRKAIETVPPGNVLVCDARKERRAATAGDILMRRLQVRGVAGFVSDGGLRDVAEIAALDLPVYCAGPSAPANVVHHHAADVDVPIACGDVVVYPGDVMLGDADGVVVIPAHLAKEVAEEAVAQTDYENFAAEEVMAGRSIFGVYPPDDEALRRYERWRASR